MLGSENSITCNNKNFCIDGEIFLFSEDAILLFAIINLKCDRKKSRLPERQLLFDGEDFLSFCFLSNVCDLVSKVIKIMRMGAPSH